MALDVNSLKYGKAVSDEEYVYGKEILAKANSLTSPADKAKTINSTNDFLTAADDFFYSVNIDATAENAFNAAEYFKERQQQADELKQRAAALSLYMDENADIYTPESYDTLKNILSTFNTQADEAIANLDSYFNEWGSYDAYDDYQAKRTLDVSAAEKELAEMQAARDDYAHNHEFDWTSAVERNAYDLYLQDLDKQISDKRQFTNQAKRLQEGIDLASVTGNEDFADKSGYVSTYADNPLDSLLSQFNMGYNDLTYEYINNQNGIRDEISRLAKGHGYTRNTTEGNYEYMTPEEVAIYNYHYATGGKEKAQQYLDNIQESLNYRKANELVEDLSGNTMQEYKFAVAAGLDQSKQGIRNFLNTDDDYLDYSAYQIASPKVREDLADNGIKLPDALGGASLGQVAYDIINTGANMAPAMLAGLATGMINPALGKLTGSALMGMNAGGGALQEALNEGYAREQARKYAVESGIAEAGMEYLLGGIGAFSNGIVGVDDAIKAVSNPVGRFALNLGKGMGSEAFEEGLQEYISPKIKNKNLYTEEKASASDIAYASILGGLTGGVMDLPGSVSSSFSRRTPSGSSPSSSADVSSDSAPDIKAKVSEDGNAKKISTNENVVVLDFAEIKNGNATIQMKDGSTAAYNDVSFAYEGEANQFYAVKSLPGIDTENANNLLHTIKEAKAGEDIGSVAGIRESYCMGYYGAQETDLAKGTDSSTLSPALQKAVFDIGRQQRNADALATPTATATTATPAQGYKKVVFEGKVNQNNNKRHSAEIAFVDYIADNFSGNTVHIYESFKGRDGKYYYRDNNGELHKAPNGKYVNGEIWLDLKSGDNGKGLMLNTFSREMYHHIEKFNKSKAQELAEFVSKELGYENVEKGVAEQIKKARKAGLGESYFERKGMTAEQARNEVYTRAMSDFVADSLETMFTRGNPAEAIAKLKTENRTLFDEIKNFIDKWVSKLKKYYSDKTVTAEGEAVAQLEKFEELQQMFMEAMQGAGENYRAALSELTPGEEGEIVNDNGELAAASTKDQLVKHFGHEARPDGKLGESALYSLRNEDNSPRAILSRIDPNSRKLKSEQQHLGFYQERLKQLGVAERRLNEVNAKIRSLPENSKREIQKLQTEARNWKHNIDIFNRDLKRAERSEMFKRIVAEERKKLSDTTLRKYKEEQRQNIKSMQAENRAIREELTGTQSVMTIMEDEFVRLAKDLEAKKIDLKTMQEMFLNQSKQYDKDTQKWLREYRNLMSQYRKLDARNDRNLSKIEQLEEIIQRQRKTAKAKVTSRRNTEMRHKIQRKANELNQLLIHGTKHRNVPEYLQPVVADILDAINMEVRDGDQRRANYEATLARYDRQIAMTNNPAEVSRLIEKRNEYAAKGDQFANKMAELQKAYERIQKDKIPNMEIDEGLSARLMELFVVVGDTPLGQMTSQQLDAVNDVLNITKATITNANKLFKEGQRKGIDEISKTVMREVRVAGGGPHKTTDSLDFVSKFGWNNLKPVYAFEAIGSNALTTVFNNLRKGEDTLAVDLMEAKTFFQTQWKKHHGNDWDMEKKWKFTSTSGKSFELDLNQIMSLYALSKRNHARNHLRVGGFSFDSQYKRRDEIKVGPIKIKADVKTTDASAYNLTDETLGEIISKLTPQQRAFVDAMQEYLSDTMAAKGNEVSLQKYGIRLFKEQNYFPLHVADQYKAKVREQQTGDRKLKNAGFTHDVEPEANSPVVLSSFTEVWAEHVDEMSLYHSFVLPLDDLGRVMNYKDMFTEETAAGSVVEAIRNAYGDVATQYIDQLIRDVNGGARTDSVASIINKWIGKAKKAQTMASLSVAIQQPSSILRACAMIDGKYFVGPKVTEKTHDRTWNEIKKYAPIAIIKEMGGFDVNVGKSTVDYLTDTADYKGFGEKFKAMFTDEQFRDDVFGRLPALMDEMSWGVIWNAVKREQAELHPNVKGDAFMKLVSDRFTDVIVNTQVYDSVFSRSGMMRSKDTGAKMMTSFMAEPTTTINMLFNTILQAKRGKITKTQVAKTAGAIVASLALNSALQSIVYAMRDDDEDKRYDEKWIENFYENFFNSLNPLGYIPFLRDVQNAFRGYDAERSDITLFAELMNAVQGLNNDDLSAWDKTEAVLGSVGNLLGVPLKNILRDSRGIAKTIAIALDKESRDPATKTGRQMARKAGLQSAAKGINPFVNVETYNNGEEMLLAIQKGDDAHIQRVFGRFENQQKAESALQRAIREKYVAGEMTAEEATELLNTAFDREDENEVYWLLEDWNYAKENDGSSEGYTKYGSLYEAIESGDYEDEISRFIEHGADASTIRSQISKKYRKEYLADETVREQIREKLQPVYEATGMQESDIDKKFNDWDFEAEYGMTYSEFKSEYKAGNATEAELRNAMKFYGRHNFEIEEDIRSLNKEKKFEDKYGMTLSDMKDAYDNGDISKNDLINALVFNGATRSEARDEVGQRDVTNKYGIDYMKLDDAYKYGDISRQTFYNSMRESGATKEEADEAILGYDWLKKNVKKYPDLQISDAKRFVIKVSDKMEERTLSDYGVSIDSYITYKEKAKDCNGVDADGDGYADPYTKAKQLFAMIDNLPISNEAKTGLALISNAKSTIKKYAPWY